MERERQEPTVGKVDLKDVSFQPRLRRAQHAQGNAYGSEDSKLRVGRESLRTGPKAA